MQRRRGGWAVYLLTPELSVVRTRAELELYVARTGAVIDSNTVNFSPPQQTALMDAELAALQTDTESVPSRRSKRCQAQTCGKLSRRRGAECHRLCSQIFRYGP